jgi:hypothetical protein
MKRLVKAKAEVAAHDLLHNLGGAYEFAGAAVSTAYKSLI